MTILSTSTNQDEIFDIELYFFPRLIPIEHAVFESDPPRACELTTTRINL